MADLSKTCRTCTCSFCGKDQHQVQRLIGGPRGIFICNECIALCQEILNQEQVPGAAYRRSPQPPTPTPCPECQSERILVEAASNLRLTALDGASDTQSELWAALCPNCGYMTFYAKKPYTLTR